MRTKLIVKILFTVASISAVNGKGEKDLYELVKQLQTENIQMHDMLLSVQQDIDDLKKENVNLQIEIAALREDKGNNDTNLAHLIETSISKILQRGEIAPKATLPNPEKRFLIPTPGTTGLPTSSPKLTTTTSTATPVIISGKIAFSATLGKSVDNAFSYIQYTAIFDKVLSNIGGAYSPSTGVFTAPQRGAYYFISNIQSNDKSLDTIYIVHNNITIYSWDKGTDMTGTAATVLSLDAGDKVCVQHYLWGKEYASNWQTGSFSGFLI